MWIRIAFLAVLAASVASCSDDDGGTEADRLGVGAACTSAKECAEDQDCLLVFKGGYCGVSGCTKGAECPAGSACVAHDDGQQYCFRTCTAKTECNANRGADEESNCSSSVTFVDSPGAQKACVPPSGSGS